jgi:hypothetical protein
MRLHLRSGLLVVAFAVATGFAARADASSIIYSPTPYLQAADSPFSSVSFSYFWLENFEDGLFNTPGVTASAGVVNPPNMYVDSVDSDDGVIDGSGSTLGYSFYPMVTSLTFTFDADSLGSLPTHAGLVWTDIGYNSPTPYHAPVSFEAFGPLGASLGAIGPFELGDGTDQGEAGEDRFFGAFNTDGISAIRISTNTTDWEIDHLQYGAESPTLALQSPVPVPEPSTLTLLGLGVVVSRYRAYRRGKSAAR